jgi:hypothetical protein
MLALYGFFEIFITRELYTFINLTDYLHMKFAAVNLNRRDLVFYGIQDSLDFLTVPFLNLSGEFGLQTRTLRIVGPIFHFISYGYSLAFGLLVAMMCRRYIAAILMLPVMLLVGSKGAIVMTVLALITVAINKTSNSAILAKWALLVLLAAYIGLVLIYGYLSQDNHFLGLMGGLKGFLSNPLGHGVGVGGVMSDTNISAAVGGEGIKNYAGDFALESGFAVLLYQTGVAGLITLVLFWRALLKKMYNFARQYSAASLHASAIVLPAAFTVLFVNSLFQEEIFTPTCWGVWMLVAGFALNNNLIVDPRRAKVLAS